MHPVLGPLAFLLVGQSTSSLPRAPAPLLATLLSLAPPAPPPIVVATIATAVATYVVSGACVLPTTYCLRVLLTTYCLLLANQAVLIPTSCFLLPASYFLLPTSCFLRPASYFLLPTSCFLRPASCLLPPASCVLPPASCLLPPASCGLPPASCVLPPASLPDAMLTATTHHRVDEMGGWGQPAAAVMKSLFLRNTFLEEVCCSALAPRDTPRPRRVVGVE